MMLFVAVVLVATCRHCFVGVCQVEYVRRLLALSVGGGIVSVRINGASGARGVVAVLFLCHSRRLTSHGVPMSTVPVALLMTINFS